MKKFIPACDVASRIHDGNYCCLTVNTKDWEQMRLDENFLAVFCMVGRIIELTPYIVRYEEMESEDSQAGNLKQREIPCHTEEEAQAIAKQFDGEIVTQDLTDYTWLDGIEVADVPDPMSEALKILEMGKEAYEAEKNKPTIEQQLEILQAENERMAAALQDLILLSMKEV